ncbi:MAG: hypothetical protein EOM80_06580 [Erysipelotrichia bacterium]|nr:hypothetical protein [Candidatus Riflebacteria bacterium]NCB38421.1 hypothetical protein [Erysipelotrichia bacterium]
MGRILRNVFFIVLLTWLLLPSSLPAKDYVYNKVQIGAPFIHFDIEDIYHQRWVSTYLRGKPIIILTGHRYQRYEILKWAETFRQEYGLPGHVHLLWAVNLRRFPWSTSRMTVIRQWRDFNASIPVLMDWDGVIGRGLRINYNVPNIIVIDAFGRLALHEMHSYTPEVYAAVSARIMSLLAVNPGYSNVAPTVSSDLKPLVSAGQVIPNPAGRKGDSN